MKLNRKQFIVSVGLLLVLIIPSMILTIFRNVLYVVSYILEVIADKLKEFDRSLGRKYENLMRTLK
jgi:hypothetical protein